MKATEKRIAICIYCGRDWHVSKKMQTPKGGYICPHCESKIKAGEDLRPKQIAQNPKKKGARKH